MGGELNHRVHHSWGIRDGEVFPSIFSAILSRERRRGLVSLDRRAVTIMHARRFDQHVKEVHDVKSKHFLMRTLELNR